MKALLSACVRALRAQSISVDSYITLNSDGSVGWFVTTPDNQGSASYNVEPGARVVQAEPKEYDAMVRQLEQAPERVKFEEEPAPNFQEPPENQEGWAFVDEETVPTLCDAIIGCENFASKEQSRPNINCIHICRAEKNDGPAVVVATDGHMMNTYTFSEELDLPDPAINYSLRRETAGIINRFTVIDVAFCNEASWFSGIDKNGAMITYVDGYHTSNDVRFPDWRRVVGDAVNREEFQETNPVLFFRALYENSKAEHIFFLTNSSMDIQTAHAVRVIKKGDPPEKVRDVLIERDVFSERDMDPIILLENEPLWVNAVILGDATIPKLKKQAAFMLDHADNVSVRCPVVDDAHPIAITREAADHTQIMLVMPVQPKDAPDDVHIGIVECL